VAFLLSGGVDSNALAAVAARVLGRDVHAFTIENSDPRYAETELVRHAVERLGIRHTSLPLEGADLLRDLPRLVRQHDGPVYTITYYVHWLLLGRVAESGHRVTVSGTGADELFSGYFDHHLAYLYEVRNDPALHRRALQAWTRCVRPHVRNPWLQDPDLFINDPGFRGHLYFDADAFAACLVQPWSEPFTEGRYGPGLLRNRMLNELFHEAVPPILHQDDLNAMSHSLENRSPFLDRRLFDVCQRIPTRHLVRDGRAKAVLRDAMRGIVPDRILDEPRKVGFNAPIADLIDVRSPDVRRALLADGPVFELVRRDAVAALLEEPHLPNSRSKFLFNFVNARVFLDEFAS
jgi:asparagine synthase (glutamine-hydrolysing)